MNKLIILRITWLFVQTHGYTYGWNYVAPHNIKKNINEPILSEGSNWRKKYLSCTWYSVPHSTAETLLIAL